MTQIDYLCQNIIFAQPNITSISTKFSPTFYIKHFYWAYWRWLKCYFIKFLKLLQLYASWLSTEVHTISRLLTQYCYIQKKAIAIGNNSVSRFPVLWVVLFNVCFINISDFRIHAAIMFPTSSSDALPAMIRSL